MFTDCYHLRKICLAAFMGLFAVRASAQIQVAFPAERAIFQRKANGTASVTVSGTFASELDKIEVRALPVAAGQGTELGWTTLEQNPKGGVFSGSVDLQGGWYSLEVRGVRGDAVTNTGKVSKMGVGEVFIISGQSNAQGVDANKDFPLPQGAGDDRVNFIDYNNITNNSLNDPPAPVFQQLQLQDDVHIMGPVGITAWCWGYLGDLLTKKLNVPVLFINTAWSGTSIINWVESSQNIPTTSVYSDLFRFPDQMPYGNLRMAVQHYASQYGARAILWMQGESDNYPVNMSTDRFKHELEFLIKKLGSDTNTKLPWVISKTSRSLNASGASITSQAIIAAQNAVIAELRDVAFNGPDTDDLPITRVDGLHFYGDAALSVLAGAWNNVLESNALSAMQPLAGNAMPKIEVKCEPDNNVVSLTVPDTYRNYVWTIERDGNTWEEHSRVLMTGSPGVYSARVKDEFGNTIRTQKVVIDASIKPSTPTINTGDYTQVCADSSSALKATGGNGDRYRWFQEGSDEPVHEGATFTVQQSGRYFVRSQNVYGCYSDHSNATTVLVRDVVPTPEIERIGPFNIAVKSSKPDMELGLAWSRDQQTLSIKSDTIAPDAPGKYSARFIRTFELNGGFLACYSPYSNDISLNSDEVAPMVVFPNPVSEGEIHIESKKYIVEADITLYDSFGRVLISQKKAFGQRTTIPVSHLKTGLYIIRIKTTDLDFKKQIVIK